MVNEDKRKENIFEIPVSASAQFKIGQKVEVTIYSNTTEPQMSGTPKT
ncbi:hypothetical protein [Psychrobacillus sp. NPDC096623]